MDDPAWLGCLWRLGLLVLIILLFSK